MGLFNTHRIGIIAILLLSLSITLSAYTTQTPRPSSSPISLHGAPSKAPDNNSGGKKMDEEAKGLQYLKAHMTSAITKVDRMVASITPEMSAKCRCAHACQEMYVSSSEELSKGLANVEARDWFSLNVIMTGFSTYITTCDDCLNESDPRLVNGKHCPKLGDFDAWITGVANDFLAISIKYSTLPHY